MAQITGIDGYVTYTATVILGVTEWSMDYSADIFEITEFANSAPTHKSKLSGLKSATITLTGAITDAATGIQGAITVGSSYDLTLYTETTHKWSCAAICTSVSPSVPIGGLTAITANFESNGDVTPPSYS